MRDRAVEYHEDYLAYLVTKGGPARGDYTDLVAWLAELDEQSTSGTLSSSDVDRLRLALGDALSPSTMQGFAYRKPHGYAGDFEIIDRLYCRYTSAEPHLKNWDLFFQAQPAANAVRNRVNYFKEQVLELEASSRTRSLTVLNLASGPGRDLLSVLGECDSEVRFECIDQDPSAIAHARCVCTSFLERVRFRAGNVLRTRWEHKYDLIWSAGLFDYFSDRAFVFMLKRLKQVARREIIIGNFSPANPSRPYMRLFDWQLEHRSPQRLLALAQTAGFSRGSARVGRERCGVNLFLHLPV